MKIGIFETEHFEAAYPLVRLFDNGQNEITIFCYPAAQRQLAFMLGDRSLRYNWVTKKEDQSRRSFIHTIKNETKEQKLDLLYLNTVSDNYISYAMMARSLPSTRIVLTVHMINSLFETTQQYKPRKLLHAIGKRLLRNTIKEFNVLSQAMVQELAQRLSNDKKIYNIPGGIYEGRQPHDTLQHPIHIVIPGSIDRKRRNYEQAFELLTLLKKENIPVKMTFLGRFVGEYGQLILAKCQEYKESIIYYSHKEIDQPEFDRVLQSADFLFIPSIVHTIMDGVREIYGTSISSGNIADAIRHAKPVIIPQSLVTDPWLSQSCICYNTVEEITTILRDIYQSQSKYNQLSQSAIGAAKEYTVEKIRERNSSLAI